MHTSHPAYTTKKNELVTQYKAILAKGESVRLQKSTSNLFRKREGRATKLDTRAFNTVISVDAKKMIAEVEGMTPYRTIVRETLKYGVLPAVVPELATITVGGAVSGGGIEANSIYNGLVHETVLEMDVLLPTGEVITATPTNKYKDLFYGIANSFGTLGYILKLTIKLIPTKPYVKLRHIPMARMDDMKQVIEEVAQTKKYEGELVDFIDGSGFEKDDLYVTLATFTDEAPRISNYRYMRRYFESIKSKREDYLTVRDFIWRWDSDWFWCSKAFYMNHLIPRLLGGKWMLKSETYWKWFRWDQKYKIAEKIRKLNGDHAPREVIIQDVQVPIEKASEFWDFYTQNITIRPVWFCPTRSASAEKFPLYTLKNGHTYLNFGFWDEMVAHPDDPHYYNKLIEAKVTELGGKKGLYSEAFYEENEFWQLYNGQAYKKLKQKYDPDDRLKNLYEKCVKNG
jgi:FAD/FMN-containing dehydrogenase